MPHFPNFPAPSGASSTSFLTSKAQVSPKGFFQTKSWKYLRGFFCVLGIITFSMFCLRACSLQNAKNLMQIKQDSALHISFEMDLFESRPSDFMGSITFGNPTTVSDVVMGLIRAAKDDRITALIGYLPKTNMSLSQIQEVRDAILAVRKAGKKTIVYAPSLGEFGSGLGLYYLATAFEEIRIQPTGEVGVSGIAIESPYLRKALEKVGIKPAFASRHEYKTGGDTVSGEKMSDQERENLTAVLNSFVNKISSDIADARSLPVEDTKHILLNGPYFAEKALEMKLIDKLEYSDALEKELKENYADLVGFFDYLYQTEPKIKSKTPVVAYVPAVGVIQFGNSIFGGDSYRSILGVSTFGETLREAADHESVKAIVVRLDSPGGGYTPSDALWRELIFVKEHSEKPIICSMGSSAASGGYFISLGCDKVFAQPSTLTGSIGVFGGKLVVKELLEKLDINISSIKMGKNAGLGSAASDFTPEQHKYFNDSLDRVYDDFTKKVAARRDLTPQQTDTVARGRVFTGEQAVANGLVDEEGGIVTAINAASGIAGFSTPLPVVEFPLVPTRLELFMQFLTSDTISIKTGKLKVQGIVPAIKAWAERLSSGDMKLFFPGFSL